MDPKKKQGPKTSIDMQQGKKDRQIIRLMNEYVRNNLIKILELQRDREERERNGQGNRAKYRK